MTLRKLEARYEQLLSQKHICDEENKKLRAKVDSLNDIQKDMLVKNSATTERLANENSTLKGQLIELKKVSFDAERAKRDSEAAITNESSVNELRR